MIMSDFVFLSLPPNILTIFASMLSYPAVELSKNPERNKFVSIYYAMPYDVYARRVLPGNSSGIFEISEGKKRTL